MISFGRVNNIRDFFRGKNTFIKNTPPEEKPSVEEPKPGVDCAELVESSDGCNLMATGEGGGGYDAQNPHTSAAGRYQFTKKTAVYALKGMGKAKTDSEASNLWENCKNGTSVECKGLQDSMCNWYFSDTIKQMKHYGVAPTKFNMYLAWNQGPYGASKILDSKETGIPVTDPTVQKHMTNQSFYTGGDSYSGEVFLKDMQSYLHKQNYPGV